MAVPFIDLKRTEPDFVDRWLSIVEELSRKFAFIGGEAVQKLESRLTDWTQTRFAVSCANGTDAIQLALRATGVKKNDIVLLPDATFWATFEAVVNVGANPCTVAIDPSDGCVDFTELEKAIEDVRPKAVIIVHLYGWGPSRLHDIRDLCYKKGVVLIEDGAQSFGAAYMGESIYKRSFVATTSFYPAKVLGAAGDGGAVFTNDERVAAIIRQLANHGRTSHYEHGLVGWNSRMDALQAAYVDLSLEYFSERLASRRNIVQQYERLLKQQKITALKPSPDYLENGYCNVNLVQSRKIRSELEVALKEHQIGFANIYPMAVSDQSGADGYLVKHFGPKTATDLSQRVLNFPLFPYMTEQELTEITSLVNKL